MIKSVRYFLLISLLLSITLASAINGIGNYLLDEKVIQPYLDSQLTRTAALVSMLYETTKTNPQKREIINQLLKANDAIDGRNLLFQIWDEKGQLLLQSDNHYNISLHHIAPGFSDQVILGNDWRLYSFTEPKLHVKIIVAELYNLRRDLADDIARSNANVLLVTYPVFGLLVWLIIGFALRSITRVANEISNRASTYLEPVHLAEIPVEIKPLVAELNQLFIRLKLAFERNKRFAADAAHELRTPLAALKTHVQVALQSTSDEDRNKALSKVIESVDRSSHVVAQLLTLSKLGDEEALTDIHPVDLHKLATEIIAYLAPHALEKNIEIELSPVNKPLFILGNDTAIGILIRNVVDNAIRYTPDGGNVKISIFQTQSQVILRTQDSGPGVPLELRERIFERFFRILGTKASGSGLGLAIVSQIAALHHAEIRLDTPEDGIGLQFDVAFPSHQA